MNLENEEFLKKNVLITFIRGRKVWLLENSCVLANNVCLMWFLVSCCFLQDQGMKILLARWKIGFRHFQFIGEALHL